MGFASVPWSWRSKPRSMLFRHDVLICACQKVFELWPNETTTIGQLRYLLVDEELVACIARGFWETFKCVLQNDPNRPFEKRPRPGGFEWLLHLNLDGLAAAYFVKLSYGAHGPLGEMQICSLYKWFIAEPRVVLEEDPVPVREGDTFYPWLERLMRYHTTVRGVARAIGWPRCHDGRARHPPTDPTASTSVRRPHARCYLGGSGLRALVVIGRRILCGCSWCIGCADTGPVHAVVDGGAAAGTFSSTVPLLSSAEKKSEQLEGKSDDADQDRSESPSPESAEESAEEDPAEAAPEPPISKDVFLRRQLSRCLRSVKKTLHSLHGELCRIAPPSELRLEMSETTGEILAEFTIKCQKLSDGGNSAQDQAALLPVDEESLSRTSGGVSRWDGSYAGVCASHRA